jgi:tetratricopeptide (TPR) repeat protein
MTTAPSLLLLWLAAQSGSPSLPDILSRARQHLEASDRPAARRELTEALRLYPGSPAVHNFLGVLEAAEGNYKEAERRFRDAILRGPQYTDAYLNLGRLYQENGARDPQAAAKALAAYGAILGYAPGHAEARFQSAALHETLGDFERSLEALGRLPPADQDRPAALAVRCADHVGKGERAQADETAGRLLERSDLAGPDVRPILPTLAAHGREDLARRLLEALRARGQASPDDLRSLGLLQEKEGQLAAARETLEEAARGRPDHVGLLLDLARVAHEVRDHKGALGYLAHARALEPGNARIHFFFGMVCVDLDLGAEAYNSLKEAVRLDPENPAVNYAMGAVALHRKDPAEAIPYFRKYSELRPGDRRGPFALGIAAFEAEDFETARAELVPAAARPETAAGATYFLARMARAENDYEEALRLAQKAIEANPDYPDPYSELGLLYVRLGQPERAEQALKRCLEIDPEHYLGNLHLLMLYAKTKDPRHAAQAERFAEIERRWKEKATDFLRPIEVRPY